MKVFERYLERNRIWCEPDFSEETQVIVIIPVLNDREIFHTLDSLRHCISVREQAGIIVVVNHGENCEEQLKAENRLLSRELQEYAGCCKEELHLCIIEAFDLPVKYAGVGWARKIAMDVAAAFFYRWGRYEAPIVSLDADTLVEDNYLQEIVTFFRKQAVTGVSVAYAHRLDEEGCEGLARLAMVKYELYLRYYQMALAYTGHPHAYACIGSAFAVRAVDYVAQGGMNRRQAGEDFYFLQKLIATGRFAALNSTRVYPSARFSDRTPFGTGQSLRQIVERQGEFPVYHFGAFLDLKYFFSGLPVLYKSGSQMTADYISRLAPHLQDFLKEIDIEGPNSFKHKNMIRLFENNVNRLLRLLRQIPRCGKISKIVA